MGQSGLLEVDPAKQWDWHEAHRDMSRNQYRTSYTDMTHFKEVNVKSDYPSGYGGHIPSIRHDILFKNTAFDRQLALRRNDPSRDAHPSYKDQISGIPTWCSKPQGAKKNPSYGVVPHDGTTSNLVSPWGVVKPVNAVPSFRNVPASLKRARSMPGLTAQASAGAQMMSQSPMGQSQSMAQMMPQMAQMAPSPSQGSDRLKRTVSIANAQSNQQPGMTEQEMLMEEMAMQQYAQEEW